MPMTLSLLTLQNSEEADVVSVDSGHGLSARLERLGLRPGVRVKKVSENGPVVAIRSMFFR